MTGALGEKRDASPGDLGYRGPARPGQLGYQEPDFSPRQTWGYRPRPEDEAGASNLPSGGGVGFSGARAFWPNSLDCAFGIRSVNHNTKVVTVAAGYIWGFSSGLAIAETDVTCAGTAETPQFIYASGACHTLSGTIAAATATLDTLNADHFGKEDKWVCPLYRTQIVGGLLRIMPVMWCPNIRSHYGP